MRKMRKLSVNIEKHNSLDFPMRHRLGIINSVKLLGIHVQNNPKCHTNIDQIRTKLLVFILRIELLNW